MSGRYTLAAGGVLLVLGFAAAWVTLGTSMWIGFRLIAGIFALLWILAALRAFWRAA